MTNPAPGQVTETTRAELEERRAELQYLLELLTTNSLSDVEEQLAEVEHLLGEEKTG